MPHFSDTDSPVPLDTLNRVLRSVCQRNRLSAAEAEELRSLAYVKLLEDRERVLGRFQGRSSMETYLRVVLQRILLDARIRERGKWRPSAAARRHGPMAVRLEQLMARDGLTRNEAVETLARATAAEDREALHDLAAVLPNRPRRRFLGEAPLVELHDPTPSPEEIVIRSRLREQAGAVHRALRAAVMRLTEQERRMLAWRFRDNRTVREIAAAVGLPPCRAYRLFDAILRRLRRAVELSEAGRGAAVVARDGWHDSAVHPAS